MKAIKKKGSLVLALVVAAYYLAMGKTFDEKKPLSDFILTKHAKCRMGCRHIDRGEISFVLDHGRVNLKKSEPHKKPCPIIVKEGKSERDNQTIRVVAAQCSHALKIVTVIDLDRNYNCHCD